MKVPVKSKIDTGMIDFEGTRSRLKKWWLYVIDETYLGMMNVVKACLKLGSFNFFTASFGKHVSLEEFESVQTNCTNTVSILIKISKNSKTSRARLLKYIIDLHLKRKGSR